ncbi:MAG: hypothetical protein ABSD98_19390 [Candidatus Korobacteraceae bacterium]
MLRVGSTAAATHVQARANSTMGFGANRVQYTVCNSHLWSVAENDAVADVTADKEDA